MPGIANPSEDAHPFYLVDETGAIVGSRAFGWRDDGSESGVQRAELVRGGLVAMPFIPGNYRAVAMGGGVGAPANNTGALFHENTDGTKSAVTVAVNAAASWGNGAWMMQDFWGDKFGLRRSRLSGLYTGDIVSLMIDNVGYMIDPRLEVSILGQTTTNASPYGLAAEEVFDDLGPGRYGGRHTAEVYFPCNQVATAWHALLGYVVDGQAGYAPYPRGANIGGSKNTLTAATWVVTQPPFSTDHINGWYKVTFAHNVGSALKASGGSTTTSLVLVTSGGAKFAVGNVLNVLGAQTVITAISTDTLTVSPALPATPPDGTPVNVYATVDVRFSSSDSTPRWSKTILTGDAAEYQPANGAPVTHAVDIRSSVTNVLATFAGAN